MSQPKDTTPGPQANPPVDPLAWTGAGTPNTPQELIAMQANLPASAEEPEPQQGSDKVQAVLQVLEDLVTNPAEDQQIALFLLRRLENFHDLVVSELKRDDDAKHSQIVSWAVDADRLYRSRMLLETVDLE